MILELADIRIQPGQQLAFEAALRRGISEAIGKAEGCLSCRVQHGIETPERYVLLVEWATLEHHTIGFRGSPAFAEWRSLVGPFFAAPPAVEHFSPLA